MDELVPTDFMGCVWSCKDTFPSNGMITQQHQSDVAHWQATGQDCIDRFAVAAIVSSLHENMSTD